ncbi:MAG TPA: radical SAM protein [Desulfonatronum sp.]|nr:radical SAM protein [Desulfonatronum sp.]
MLYADARGRIFDQPDLNMVCRLGEELRPPRPQELIPLPGECELFLLPGRRAMGWDERARCLVVHEQTAVAAFVSPGHTLTAICAYQGDEQAPVLPLFAYAAAGYAQGRFWVCAAQVDQDPRQRFAGISRERIHLGARQWLKAFPNNRLVRHLTNCALVSSCPAARNLVLGRFEAPLPTSQSCNARCLGCLSLQPPDSGFPSTQKRITFRPSSGEILQIMQRHARREQRPIFSFGQGCEGEPLTEAVLIMDAVRRFRSVKGPGTVNINTNASLPDTIQPLARAGVSSIRVSLNSAIPERYAAYHRPQGHAFEAVQESIRQAKKSGLFVSLNLLYFPGVSDTAGEVEALIDLVRAERVDFIQMRNMNLDPELYLRLDPKGPGPAMGLIAFLETVAKAAPWVRFGYFNPYLEK